MSANYNPFSLVGKRILVTGASSGIGQRTAIECSRLGAQVIITGRNEERLQETFSQLGGEGHEALIADLTKNAQLENLISLVREINGAVFCAGKSMTAPFPFCTEEKFEEVFRVNFFSQMELLRLLVKKKLLVKQSSVVFVSSIGGIERFSLGNGVYGASKAAIHSMMKTCAKELAPKKIRVNSVNPGMVKTHLIEDLAISPEQLDADMQNYPLKRFGEPEDIAYGIIYLLSDASSWVTGHALVIDGGVTV